MKPNVLIIVLDAVRAQNLPFYGYHRNTTPFLYSVKGDLAVYENAVSSCYWTMPSVASLFTGMYKSGHGLLVEGDKLDKNIFTLPSVLREHGYRTLGFVKNVYVSEFSGLDRDFDEFVSEYFWDSVRKGVPGFMRKMAGQLQPPGITRQCEESNSRKRSSREKLSNLVARCFDVLIDRGSASFLAEFEKRLEKKSGPFFAYFHLLETHMPYRAPLGFALSFLSLPGVIRKISVNHDHLRFLLGESLMTERDFEILRSAYDNSIKYADHIIKKIFRLLEKKGVLGDTMIVILSDHGDNVGEHGLMSHYFCLYDTLIRVPFLVKFPAGTGTKGVISEVVQNTDVYPTVLSLLNIQDMKFWRQVQGNDLAGRAAPRREKDLAVTELVKVLGPDRSQYKDQLARFNRRLLALRTRDRKFIYSSRGDHECYDLKKDPGELKNLYEGGKGFSDLKEKAFRHYERMNNFYTANREKIEGGADLKGLAGSVAGELKSLGYM